MLLAHAATTLMVVYDQLHIDVLGEATLSELMRGQPDDMAAMNALADMAGSLRNLAESLDPEALDKAGSAWSQTFGGMPAAFPLRRRD